MSNTTTNTDSLTDGLMGDFLDESTDIMRRLNDGLSQLDGFVKHGETLGSDEELLNSIFRAAHSLKGLSGMMGFQDVNALTHKMENVFDAVRIGRLPITAEVVDVSFQAIDRLDAMIDVLKGNETGDVEFQGVLDRIEAVLQGTSATAAAKPNNNVTEKAAPGIDAISALDPLADIQDDTDVPAKYLSIFLDECELTLDTLGDVLLQTLDASAVESLLVYCHRIKGSAASIGLQRVARLAHLMEDQLQELRRLDVVPSTVLVDAMLTSTDVLRGYLAGLKSGTRNDSLLREGCLAMTVAGAVEPQMSINTAEQHQHSGTDHQAALIEVARAAAPQTAVGFAGCVTFEQGLPLVELKAKLLIEKLLRTGTLCYCNPKEEELDNALELCHFAFCVLTEKNASELTGDLHISGVVNVELAALGTADAVQQTSSAETANTEVTTTEAAPELDGAEPTPKEAARGAVAPSASADSKNKPTETLRVDIDRLDQLMNLAGQLVITKARFSQIGQKLKRLFSDKTITNSLVDAAKQAERLTRELRAIKGNAQSDSLALNAQRIQDDLGVALRDVNRFAEVRGLLNDLAEAAHQLDRVSDGIQSSVMDTRMVPIGPLFSRFKRVVRDLGRGSGKEINLEIRGEHTELDKRMIDELGDPLIHLIRNSADHGIELPEDRLQAGKDRAGKITLNAFHRGNRIVIQVCDNGRGLNVERIRAKAVAKGWISEADAEKLPDSRVYQFIWRPGFSTAEKVTEVSGRGMGMDIVGDKIEQLNGSVELSSTPGQGTTFEIRLPLTMAILPSLLMVIDSAVFAVPVESVIEIVRIAGREVTTVYGKETACVRGRVISLVRLSDLFRGQKPTHGPLMEQSSVTIVIAGSEGRELGIVVDDLLGEQDVVIKSLNENFQNVEGIAGASILGDGRVSLILDVPALLQMSYQPAADATAFNNLTGDRSAELSVTA